MISFRDIPKHTFGDLFDKTPIRKAMEAYAEHCDRAFRDAILRHLGHWPDDDTLRRHALILVAQDGVRHLAWFDRKPVIGEKPDMTKVLVSIQPPFRYSL